MNQSTFKSIDNIVITSGSGVQNVTLAPPVSAKSATMIDPHKLDKFYRKTLKRAKKKFGTDILGNLRLEISMLDTFKYQHNEFNPVPRPGLNPSQEELKAIYSVLLNNLVLANRQFDDFYDYYYKK